jgi:hypothetical protein
MIRGTGGLEGSRDLRNRLVLRGLFSARQFTHCKSAGKADQKNERDKDNLGHGHFPEIQAQRHDGRILKKEDQEQNHDDNDGYRFRIPHKKFLRFLKNWVSQ